MGNRDLVDIEYLRKRFIDGEYAISDHAIIEARKDGIVPRTVEKLEWIAISGKVIEGEIMVLIKKRKCPECGGEMEAKLINLNYKREGVDLEVEVIGIPANVCARCFYRVIPGKIAQYNRLPG